MRRNMILLALLAGIAGAGCESYYGASGYSSGNLAYVGPGVSVVTGYDYPVFYSNNFYWRYDNGFWYRSPHYYGGWSYYRSPPPVVLGIHNPWSYRNYHPYSAGIYGYRNYHGGYYHGGYYRSYGGGYYRANHEHGNYYRGGYRGSGHYHGEHR